MLKKVRMRGGARRPQARRRLSGSLALARIFGASCYGVTGVLEVPWGGGNCPMFTPIVDGGAGGASPGSELKTTGAAVGGPGMDGTVTGTANAGPGRIGV
jgi:hypothetical protein